LQEAVRKNTDLVFHGQSFLTALMEESSATAKAHQSAATGHLVFAVQVQVPCAILASS